MTQHHEDMKDIQRVKGLLRRFHLRARKGLGQHFLVDSSVLRSIISAAELTPADTVIEVGPGMGILTQELAKEAGRVVAVEIDSRLASLLTETLSPLTNVAVLQGDILEMNPGELLAGGISSSYKVVANLPYYIASPVLRHFLEAAQKPAKMVVMVQKEVGESIVARPGNMSILSVSVQLYGKPAIVRHIRPESFYPSPKVDSVILSIDVYAEPAVEVKDVERFFEVVRGGFSAPRKQLRNALAQGLDIPPDEALSLLDRAHISPQRRAQTLSLEEWARLCQAISGNLRTC